MKHSYDRNQRLAAEIRSTLSDLLLQDVKDPRLADVTISGVELSADRSQARLFFSVLGDDERARQAADGFSAASAFLRRELGRRMRLRTVPELTFERDTSYEYGDRMERLFERMREEGELPPPEESDPTEGGS